MEGERPSQKAKGSLKNELKVVMKWIELVNKERKKNKKVSLNDFLDFLQVRYEPEELSIVNDFISKNFETEFNEDVLLNLLVPEDEARFKHKKSITQSFLLLTEGSKQISRQRLLEIIKLNSPMPTMNEHIFEAIEKVEFKGVVDIHRLVEYLI